MSLPETREGEVADGRAGVSRRGLVVRLAASTAVALLVSACGNGGFRPMHGTSSIGSNVSEKLAKVEIAPVPGRVGQRIRNELIFGVTGGGEQQANPLYRLEIITKETVSSTLVKIDGNARGSVYNLDADFRLIRLSDKSVVLQGASYGRAGFERFTSIYSNVRAREDAENRAAQTVGQELKTRLEAYLAGTA